MILKHIFEEFEIAAGEGYKIILNRCKICKAIKLAIVEYNKDGITIDDDGLYIRGTVYCSR